MNIPPGKVTLDDIHYPHRLFGLLSPKDFQIIWLSNLLIMYVPDVSWFAA